MLVLFALAIWGIVLIRAPLEQCWKLVFIELSGLLPSIGIFMVVMCFMIAVFFSPQWKVWWIIQDTVQIYTLWAIIVQTIVCIRDMKAWNALSDHLLFIISVALAFIPLVYVLITFVMRDLEKLSE